jgi:hypothetical protein
MSARRKTAEIIALLYEATQGPPLPIEAPALNPTAGAVAKKPPPQGGISYEKDPNRPGGGVFVASGDAVKEMYKDVPQGVFTEGGAPPPEPRLVSTPTSAAPTPGSVSSSAQALTPASGLAPVSATTTNLSPLVSFKPLARGPGANVNPALEAGAGSSVGDMQVVVNPLQQETDGPPGPGSLEQLTAADNWLMGIPGGMFDWGM